MKRQRVVSSPTQQSTSNTKRHVEQMRSTFGRLGSSSLTWRSAVLFTVLLYGVFQFQSLIDPGFGDATATTGNLEPVTLNSPDPTESPKTHLPWRRSCERAKEVRLLLVHINKAGGRSVEGTFKEYQDRHRFLSRVERSIYRKFSLLDGHRNVHQLAALAGCTPSGNLMDCESITTGDICTRWAIMVREPVARTLSAFYTTTGRTRTGKLSLPAASHFRCTKGSRASGMLLDPSASFEDWANLPSKERKKCWSSVANLQVKYLAPDYPADTEEQFQAAAKRLKQFGWVGLTERFQESMQLLSYSFELDLSLYTPVFNLNKYEKVLSANAQSVLEEMNQYDIRLYALAKQIFESRFSELQSIKPIPHDLTPFQCDKEVICWDKTNKIPGNWAAGYHPPDMTAGQYKETVLCANRNGCTRPVPPVPWYYSENDNKDKVNDITQMNGDDSQNVVGTDSDMLKGALELQDSTMSDVVPSKANTAKNDENLEGRRCFPAFLILGTRKGGTTSLYQYISKHPRVRGVKLDQGPQSGELLYFRDKLMKKSATSKLAPNAIRQEYNNAFYVELLRLHPDLESKLTRNGFRDEYLITGESSVDMGPSCATPHLYTSACGKDTKLLFLVRNPIERVVSQVRMRQRLNPGKGISLNDTIRSWLTGLRMAKSNNGGLQSESWWMEYPCLFDADYKNGVWAGMYMIHLSRWLKYVNQENLLVLKTEDMLAEPLPTVKTALRHIGLDPDEYADLSEAVQSKYNAANPSTNTAQYEELSDELRQQLRDIYRPLNLALSQNFGVDVSDWK